MIQAGLPATMALTALLAGPAGDNGEQVAPAFPMPRPDSLTARNDDVIRPPAGIDPQMVLVPQHQHARIRIIPPPADKNGSGAR